MTRILVVDDDPHLREVLRYTLERQGWSVREAADGLVALNLLRHESADLLVLDVTMPELDGIETCRRIRQNSNIPIVFLSSRDEELDRILGLEMGGDDYLTKPFSPRELVSRIKAVLRRAWVDETEVTLTVTEFAILQTLLSHPGRAYNREELTDRSYGEGHHISDRTLDSHIRRIRQKCKDAGLDPIETVHGLGYRLRVNGA